MYKEAQRSVWVELGSANVIVVLFQQVVHRLVKWHRRASIKVPLRLAILDADWRQKEELKKKQRCERCDLRF